MATPADLLDPDTAVSYSGLVDIPTATGQVDEHDDFRGAISTMITAHRGGITRGDLPRDEQPPQRLASLRRGTHWQHVAAPDGSGSAP